MLHIACVKAGARYGPEYVNILFDMIRRNLREGYPGRFVCFTDNASGIDPGIAIEPLPPGLTGWWNKLALFRPEAFPAGDRVFYLDLDTCIVGALDEVMSYAGRFAMQRDFFTEERGSSIMAWEAGTLTHIWDRWIEAGMPEVEGGDQVWIGNIERTPDMIEDVYPGCAVSYKRHCQSYPPRDAKIVAFHGEPKPHDCDTGWVKMVWKIGGGTAAEIEMICNQAEAEIVANFRKACARDLPWLEMKEAHEGHAVIVGGAPSVKTMAEEIGRWKEHGATIFALNNAYRWLLENGVMPDAQVVLDARLENAEFIPGSSKATHYLCSQCHPAVFDKASSLNAVLWHVVNPVLQKEIEEQHTKSTCLIAGGSTVGLNAMTIAYALGYRKLHLYGMDSSFAENEHHAYEQTINDRDIPMDVICEGKKFKASAWMIAQANQFQELACLLASDCEITVRGEGLIPWIALNMQAAVVPDSETVVVDGVMWPSRDRAMRVNMANSLDNIRHLVDLSLGHSVAVQAGGNIGLWPKELAKHFERVITFEPDALNFRCLEHNLKGTAVEYYNLALSDKREKKGLARRADNCGAHFLIDGDECETTTIDDLILEACDLIQLDVEGYELFALKGAQRTIERFKPVICVEQNGVCAKRQGYEDQDVIEWLLDRGYRGVLKFGRDVVFTNEERKTVCNSKLTDSARI